MNLGDQRRRTGAKTVLVIDDMEVVRETLILQLAELGFSARGANDGAAGLEEVQRNPPDLVLCDLRMPRMDGLQFLRAVRATHPDLPVLVMSGAGLLEDAVGALKLGAWDYVEKPVIVAAALDHAIGKALERAALLEENRRYRAHLEEVNRDLSATLRQLAEDEEAGRQIQFRMLPRNNQKFGAFEFSRELMPSAFLSGDFIDAFAIDDQRWGFYLADVAGHGVSSALVTVLLRTFVQRHVADRSAGADALVTNPARLLERLNEEMLRQDLDKHVTMFYGVVDSRASTLVFANAGHFPWPLLHDSDTTTSLEHSAFPLGLVPQPSYRQHVIILPPKVVLSVFSDGLLEMLPHPSLAEKQTFLKALFGRTGVSAAQIRKELSLDDHPQLPDDVAFLMITRGS